MSNSKDTELSKAVDELISCIDDVYVIDTNTPHYNTMASSIAIDTVSTTDTVTLTSGGPDITFDVTDTIDFDNLNVTTGFGTEWVDHLPPMSVVQDMLQHYPALEKALENFKTVYKMVEQDYKGNHKDNDIPF